MDRGLWPGTVLHADIIYGSKTWRTTKKEAPDLRQQMSEKTTSESFV